MSRLTPSAAAAALLEACKKDMKLLQQSKKLHLFVERSYCPVTYLQLPS